MDEDFKSKISQFNALWQKAEEKIKVYEQSNGAIHFGAINELRYAARSFSSYLFTSTTNSSLTAVEIEISFNYAISRINRAISLVSDPPYNLRSRGGHFNPKKISGVNRLNYYLIFIIFFLSLLLFTYLTASQGGVLTQPVATIFGAMIIPIIALFGFMQQKEVERGYEIAKEARMSSRDFIDASTAYMAALVGDDLHEQLRKFQDYQSKWFQLHTVMPELFEGWPQSVMAEHYEALTAIQNLRNLGQDSEGLESSGFNELLSDVRESEEQVVAMLAVMCSGGKAKRIESVYHNSIAARFSRGSVLVQIGFRDRVKRIALLPLQKKDNSEN